MASKRKPNKTPSSPALAAKKKKQIIQVVPSAVVDTETLESVPSPAPSIADSESGSTSKPKDYSFKDTAFCDSKPMIVSRKGGKAWKNLKQIILAERNQSWPSDTTLYSHIDAPPSFKPAKKYSDLSGLPSKYRDPHSKLRYTTAEEYSRASLLPSDIVSGLLALRKANPLVA